MTKAIAIEGASGYSGMELTRLVAGHPRLELKLVTSGRWEGRSLRETLGLAGVAGQMRYRRSVDLDVDAVFLATPAEYSLERAPYWRERGKVVVDLSDAWRASADAVYGLTEHKRVELAGATLVANPGCYPTASQLALIPLVRAGLLADGPIILDAKSGISGAGRKLDDSLLFSELDGNHYPYKVGVHRHVPEIERGIGRSVLFTPHLLPTRRGLLVSAYVPVREGVQPADLEARLAEAYQNEPFVQLVTADRALGISYVVGTPLCRIGVGPTIKDGVARIFSSLDNLLKGAASQAIQNMNRVFGFDETEGIL